MDQDGSAWAERRAALRRIPLPASPDGLASEADDWSGASEADDRSGAGEADDRTGAGEADDRSGAGEADDRTGACDKDELRRVIIVDKYIHLVY